MNPILNYMQNLRGACRQTAGHAEAQRERKQAALAELARIRPQLTEAEAEQIDELLERGSVSPAPPGSMAGTPSGRRALHTGMGRVAGVRGTSGPAPRRKGHSGQNRCGRGDMTEERPTEEETAEKHRDAIYLVHTLPKTDLRNYIEGQLEQARYWHYRERHELEAFRRAMVQAGEVLKARAPQLIQPGLAKMFSVLLDELDGKHASARVPPILAEVSDLIQKRAAPLIDETKTLKKWRSMHMLRACTTAGTRGKVTQKEQVRILNEGLEVLCTLGIGRADRRPANNVNWCPASAPWGDYWWLYTVEMVQELLWLQPEFLQGYSYALAIVDGEPSIGPYRNANPYHEPSRQASWDHGYIFGITEPEKLQAWLTLLRG